MPSRAATFPNVPAFTARTAGVRTYRRAVVGGAALGLGSVSAVAVMAGTAAVAAAWMVSSSLSKNPALRAAAPIGLEFSAFPRPPQRLAEAADMFGSALASANPAYAPSSPESAREQRPTLAVTGTLTPTVASAPRTRPMAAMATAIPLPQSRPPDRATQRLAEASDMLRSALASADPAYAPSSREPNIPAPAEEPKQAATVAPALTVASAPRTKQVAEVAKSIPLPQSRPPERAPTKSDPEITSALAFAPPMSDEPFIAPLPSALVPPETAIPHETRIGRDTAVIDSPRRLTPLAPPAKASKQPAAPQLAYNNPDTPPARDSRTAIYDILAHTVYLPDGERLEAHSGLGRFLDDPHYVSQKARGPTPPNTYDLTLRSGLFHGVQALRLNPVADSRMFGRDGILAHTYMLGPSGQSFGCVSFKNYAEFLRAFQRGEINRLVVVPHLQAPPPAVRAQSDDRNRYAFNMDRDY